MTSPTRQLVGIKEAMGIARVSRTTIYNWLRDGKIDSVRTAGGPIRIYADTLMTHDETGRPAPTLFRPTKGTHA